MDRVDPDIFYDRNIVGAAGATRVGHRGVPADRFYRHEPPQQPRALLEMARRPWAFAGAMFGLGFAAVFVRQAPIHLQIILGAPVFEEMVKFGAALLLGLALSWVLSGFRMTGWQHGAWALLRVPIALAVGAGFGWLEHATTYSAESDSSYAWRVAFHAVATGMSMVAFHAALRSPDVRIRWLCVVPAVALHYVNNYAAIVLGLGSIAVPALGDIAGLLSNTVVVLLAWFMLFAIVSPRTIRRWMEEWVARLPSEA